MTRAEVFSPRSVLIIMLRRAGDVLLATPVIRALRSAYPTSKIHFLVSAPLAAIVNGNPYLDGVMTLNPKPGIFETAGLLRRVRRLKPDLVVDLHGKLRTTLISVLSGAALRLSYDRERIGFRASFYNLKAPEPRATYSAYARLRLLETLGIKYEDVTLDFCPLPVDAAYIEAFLTEAGLDRTKPIVVVAPAASAVTKQWPPERFGELADRLRVAYGAQVLFRWGPGEKQEVERAMSACKYRHWLCPPTSLGQMAALLKVADLLVGNCSSPRHVAVSQNTPTFIIHGSNPPEAWTAPHGDHFWVAKDLACRPCHQDRCPLGTIDCLVRLSVDEVFESLSGALGRILSR